jgi:hypothetical protein
MEIKKVITFIKLGKTQHHQSCDLQYETFSEIFLFSLERYFYF